MDENAKFTTRIIMLLGGALCCAGFALWLYAAITFETPRWVNLAGAATFWPGAGAYTAARIYAWVKWGRE